MPGRAINAAPPPVGSIQVNAIGKPVGTRSGRVRRVELGGCYLVVVVYLRQSRRTNRDGSVVRYLPLGHKQTSSADWQLGRQVIHNFGRADQLDRERWRGSWSPRITPV